ncbi:MAG: hypothetical protein Q4A63_04540, partial [Butyricicoccus pullicaecorum]|nr:hypothetical protein [Butyricicoccus pullicaecorum]
PENAESGEFQPIRYSALHALMQALTTTGSGRMEVLSRTVCEHAEYFKDCRVIHALIDDLADPYGDMGALIFRILRALVTGETVETGDFDGYQRKRYSLPTIDKTQLLSRLKYGFDPAGKTDMVRRMMLICAIAGDAENDWYLSLLDSAKKDIRTLVVFALGYREENIPLLMELAQKERGKPKEMAYRVLCRWDNPSVTAFIEKTLKKSPKMAACLSSTELDVYGDMAAKGLQAALTEVLGQPYISRGQMDDTIMPWISALLGKASAETIAFYQWVFADQPLPEIQEVTYNQQTRKIRMLPYLYDKLCATLVLSCPQPLVDFLSGQSTEWGEAVFLADLFTKSAAEVYDEWGGQSGKSVQYWLQHVGYDALGRRAESEQTGTLCVTRMTEEPDVLALENYRELRRPIKEPLDWRWIDTFIQNDWEEMFNRMDSDAMPEAWKRKTGAYFYQKALQVEKSSYYSIGKLRIRLYRMKQYGCQNFENILVSQCKSCYNMAEYHVFDMFAAYHEIAGRQAAMEEAQRVVAFYRSAKDGKRAESIAQILKAHGFLPESE